MKNRETVTTTLKAISEGPWLIFGIISAIILALIAWFLYRRETKRMRPAFGILLPLLRSLAIFLIVILLIDPFLHHRTQVGDLAKLVVLMDGSESMQLADPGMDAGRKIQILERLNLLKSGSVNLDLPNAAAALSEARNIAESLKSLDSPTPESCQKIASNFAALTARADELFSKSGQGAEQLEGFRKELAKPAAELGTRDLKSLDDLKRATQDLGKLSDAALRWAGDVSSLFNKIISAEGANPAVKAAFSKFDSLPRYQRIQSLLLDGAPGEQLLGQLADKFDLQLATLDNNEIKRTWQAKGPDTPLPTELPKPMGLVSNLQSGLDFTVNHEQSAGKSAILLISDGQQNAGDSPVEVAKVLAGKKMPVYSLGTGSHIAPPDIAIIRTTLPESLFHEDTAKGEILLRSTARTNLPITVSILDGEKVVWDKKLVTESNPEIKIPFEFPIKELAESRVKNLPDGVKALGVPIELKVKVSPAEEEPELSNNESDIRFRAVTQKRRILLIDGRPRWESRYLKNLYQRDEKWEVNSAIAGLRTADGFLRGDKDGTLPAEKALLDAYDLIIFGDVPIKALKPEEIRWIADFVGKRGGAILFIDGARSQLKEYADTPLGPLIPVDYKDVKPPFGLKSIALSGRANQLAPFTLSTEMAENAKTWAELPVPKSVAAVRALEGAEVLLDAETSDGRVPLAVYRPFGSGKVYYHAFDDSWRWRYQIADKYHVKFWNQIASFVAEEPFASSDKNVSLDAGKLTYNPGNQASLRVRLRDGEGKPVTDATVTAHLSLDGKRIASIPLTPDEGGLFRGKTAALEPGKYQVEIDSPAIPEGKIKVRTEFTVESQQKIERTVLSVNEDLLRQISLTSGGQYFREEQIDQLLKLLEPLTAGSIQESDTRLLESKWWFGLIVLLLTIEWLLRKRVGML